MVSRAWHLQLALSRLLATRSLRNVRLNSTATGRAHDPLRILFCGADDFSIYSLRELWTLQQQQIRTVESIDVVCRPDKRVGRGLKQLQQVPIKGIANELRLPLHQIDTFTGWSPPPSINLVIAVSFGLLVPSRILSRAKYGGLNLHPSLLPDLRGPAPIQHTLLKKRSHTGVTLQTLDWTRFDHGAILVQAPEPTLPVPQNCTIAELVHKLGHIGAALLRRSLEEGLFVPPIHDINSELLVWNVSHAPKITPEDRHIDWRTWSAEEVVLRDRVLGRLWDSTTYPACSFGIIDEDLDKRTTFQGPWQIVPDQAPDSEVSERLNTPPGTPRVTKNSGHIDVLAIKTADGQYVSAQSSTIEGEPRGKGFPTLINSLQKRRESTSSAYS